MKKIGRPRGVKRFFVPVTLSKDTIDLAKRVNNETGIPKSRLFETAFWEKWGKKK